MCSSPEPVDLPSVCEVKQHLARVVPRQGFLSLADLQKVAEGKSCRRKDLLLLNNPQDVCNATRGALETSDPVVAITALRRLRGVETPMASAVLAWTYPDRWPVIDVNAWCALSRAGLVRGCSSGIGLRLRNWIDYVAMVDRISHRSGRTPQKVDVWLYQEGKRLRGDPHHKRSRSEKERRGSRKPDS